MPEFGPIGVKICGLTEAVGFDACVEHGADWIGFVFFERSPRFVTPQQAAGLTTRGLGRASTVGLFVHPSDEDIARVLEHAALDVLQIYASEERAHQVAQVFGLPVWLSFPVAGPQDLPVSCPVQRVLIEPRPPKDATRPGGNAQKLDWSMLSGWKPVFPWMLAGGLKVDNVAEAVRITGAPAVDVSSGVESAPGVKDPALIASFVRNARQAGRA
ncbi:phosphoribosylanthranilate isomerase [Acetobacter lambici]|uniref:N-(5'-phosphoribosyl)anthranilate isomerase n=1 Tax=Acetobacter lambici TaxID=1332824 RepID=A0ABT1F2D5_9PROT|nr:phosphoribosylanthranilate isomerase [Acetobacter lambici]MCP1243457.1 phosphoribosylanthranilate isomerase [Acetobacter lambici]MCP1259384.1 phosphoribosylanthranilate isomerase [Acetobacter lambici]NHO57637.1 phosphoribosylanthranilate isomerase [Acetobacter lambici]